MSIESPFLFSFPQNQVSKTLKTFLISKTQSTLDGKRKMAVRRAIRICHTSVVRRALVSPRKDGFCDTRDSHAISLVTLFIFRLFFKRISSVAHPFNPFFLQRRICT